MDFTLSGEHLMVQKMVRDFCEREVAPIIKDADRAQTMPPQILPRMGELGILGICIPEKYGGEGLCLLGLRPVCGELGDRRTHPPGGLFVPHVPNNPAPL